MTKSLKIFIIVAVAAIFGAFMLISIGKSFIKEIIQDVNIDDAKITTDARIREKAPYFELQDSEGAKNKISDFYGKPLVIVFWTTWNQASADQIKILDELSDQVAKFGVAIVAINSQEDKSVVENFMKRGGYSVKILLDEKGEVGELYRARNLPVAYFIDKDGVLRDLHIGILNEKMLVEKTEKIIK